MFKTPKYPFLQFLVSEDYNTHEKAEFEQQASWQTRIQTTRPTLV